jgi:hypothetical protein
VVTLYAQEPAIDVGGLIPRNGDDATFLHADLYVAPGAAEAARRFVPGDAGLGGVLRRDRIGYTPPGGCRGSRHGGELHKGSSIDFH